MRIVVARLWENGAAERKGLIAAHDLDFNDPETLSEINQINSTFGNPISHDVASAAIVWFAQLLLYRRWFMRREAAGETPRVATPAMPPRA